MGHDLAPAMLQTYINPIPDCVFYFLVNHVPPKVLGFITGILQGLNFCLIFSLAYLLITGFSWRTRLALASITATTGMVAPITLAELGRTNHDVLSSLFVLGSLLLLVRHFVKHKSLAVSSASVPIAISGVLIGLGIGIKLTLATYAIGLIVALLVVQTNWKDRLLSCATIIGSSLGGAAISAGYWMLKLWAEFGNPLFPFYNAIFKSPYYPLINYSNCRAPDGLIDKLLLPFYLSTTNHFPLIQHHGYKDIRYAILFFLIGIILIYGLIRRSRSTPIKRNKKKNENLIIQHSPEMLLTVFCITSFAVWELKFSIVRYMNALEILVPLSIYLLLSVLVKSRFHRVMVYLVLVIVIFATMHPAQRFRLPWSSNFFEVDIPAYPEPENTLVIIAGSRPWGYLVPAFPSATRFIRVQGNFTEPSQNTQFQTDIRRVLNSHDGSIYLLSRAQQIRSDSRAIGAYRLRIDSKRYLPIRSKHEPKGLCLWRVTKAY
jgi:hypothetical protein